MQQLEVAGVVSADELEATADSIVDWQLASGMIPWFPGGHADPWNHVEAAMALSTCGRIAAAERAYQWMADRQRPDGAWHQYYVADRVEQDKLDSNCVAYVATGVWQHFLITGDRGFAEAMWPVVDRAVDFVLALQRPRGEIRWARHADGTPWSFALLTGSSSISHSLRAALALAAELGHERAAWADAGARLVDAIRNRPDAFAPKHRWAMDWYYPVLAGVIGGDEGRARLAAGRGRFVMKGRGVRCVSDRPWVTAAETAECCIAHLAVGERSAALEMLGWAQALRTSDGCYWTGAVYPEGTHFPPDEKTTYTAAAIILAADALSGASPAAGLLAEHTTLPKFQCSGRSERLQPGQIAERTVSQSSSGQST